MVVLLLTSDVELSVFVVLSIISVLLDVELLTFVLLISVLFKINLFPFARLLRIILIIPSELHFSMILFKLTVSLSV